MKKEILIVLALFYLINFTDCFSECPNDYSDPSIAGVYNCISWAIGINTTNFLELCRNNNDVSQKCCWTCFNLNLIDNCLKNIDNSVKCQLNDCQTGSLKDSCTTYCRTCINEYLKSERDIIKSKCKNDTINEKLMVSEYNGITFLQCSCKNNNYVGYSCNNVNECSNQKQPLCKNGQCVATDEADIPYFCKCKDGWSGINCETAPLIKKKPQNCLNGGTYNILDNICDCKFGFSGLTCEDSTILILIVIVSILSFVLILISIYLIIKLVRSKKCQIKLPSSKPKSKKTDENDNHNTTTYDHYDSTIYARTNMPQTINNTNDDFYDLYDHIHTKRNNDAVIKNENEESEYA